jgi:hypothetical protein
MSIETTPNLSLPLLIRNQSGKEITHNEALIIIDALLNNGVIDKNLSTPPANPLDGDLYIVGKNATNDWINHEKEVSFYNNGWGFVCPKIGLTLWINNENCLYTYNGDDWIETNAINEHTHQNFSLLGVNATADEENKFVVASNYVLFNRANDNIRIKANKNSSNDTASHLFQTNYSGRAEFGLIGNDNFALKVSSDGNNWNEAFVVDKNMGNVDFKQKLTVNGNEVGIEKIGEFILNNNGYIEFMNLDDGYSHYFTFENIKVATNNTAILAQISVDGGANYVNSGYSNRFSFIVSGNSSQYQYNGVSESGLLLSSKNSFQAGSGVGNGNGKNYCGSLKLFNPANNSNIKLFKSEANYTNSAGNFISVSGGGILGGGQSAYNTIKFYVESGWMVEGRIGRYRYK